MDFGGFKWVEVGLIFWEVGLILKTRKWRYCLAFSTKNYKFKQNIPPFDKKGTEFPKNSLSDSTRTNILLLFFYTPTPYLTKRIRLRHSSQNIKRQNSSPLYILFTFFPIFSHISPQLYNNFSQNNLSHLPQFPTVLHLACPNATDNQWERWNLAILTRSQLDLLSLSSLCSQLIMTENVEI